MGATQRPPPPSALPPISSKAKDYSMDRPSEVLNELDDLRNRGLAKVLNRHFTDTTRKLAKEKAAADAAIADLERRRANTSEFVPSKGGELNPFDSMYVQLQQKRAECRRKERETLLLYQRYVHKYGNKAKPLEFSPATHTTTSTVSTPEVPPPPTPSPCTPRDILQPLDEKTQEVDADVNFSKFYNKRIQESKDPPTKMLDNTSTEVPDLQDLTPQPSRESFATDPPEVSEEVRNDEDRDDLVVKKQEMTRPSAKADPPTDPPAVKFAKDTEMPKTQTLESPMSNKEDGFGWGGKVLFTTEEESATAEESSTPVETTIKPATERVEIGSNSSGSGTNRPAREVTTEVPVVTTDDEEEDDRSVISGLTMNSQVTRQVMEEIEQEMHRFLNTETEAIRQLLDEEEEEEQTMESTVVNGSVVGDESRRASMKAEAMAREMQKILDEYAKEDSSESPLATEESEVDVDTVATSGYPRKYDTSDPTKQWMVYYDESFRREYYYEVTTKTTQWEPPGGGSSTIPLLSEEVRPNSFVRTTSRRDLYRKRIRKRRMRRLGVFSLFLLCAGGSVYHWQSNHAEKTYPDAIMATWRSASIGVADFMDISLDALAEHVTSFKGYIESTLNDYQVKHEAAESELTEQTCTAEESTSIGQNLDTESLVMNEQTEDDYGTQDELVIETQKVNQDETQNNSNGEMEEATKVPNVEEPIETCQREEAKRTILQRPWACFLPLSYIHPRCNQLAQMNPLYKDTDVLNSFLQ